MKCLKIALISLILFRGKGNNKQIGENSKMEDNQKTPLPITSRSEDKQPKKDLKEEKESLLKTQSRKIESLNREKKELSTMGKRWKQIFAISFVFLIVLGIGFGYLILNKSNNLILPYGVSRNTYPNTYINQQLQAVQNNFSTVLNSMDNNTLTIFTNTGVVNILNQLYLNITNYLNGSVLFTDLITNAIETQNNLIIDLNNIVSQNPLNNSNSNFIFGLYNSIQQIIITYNNMISL